jgi:hypothetical protein
MMKCLLKVLASLGNQEVGGADDLFEFRKSFISLLSAVI